MQVACLGCDPTNENESEEAKPKALGLIIEFAILGNRVLIPPGLLRRVQNNF